jgi:chromosome segregation ATPase
MNTRASAAIVASALAGSFLLQPFAAEAQAARGGGAANAELMQQLQQLASERTSLQADNARLKQQLADVTKQRDDLKKSQQTVEQRSRVSAAALEQSSRERAASEEELTQLKARMQELIAKFRETVQTMRQIEVEGSTAKQNLATRDQQLKVCVDRNLALYKLNGEVLTHYEHDSVWAHMARAEPFTQIKRAQLENLIDDYKARAADERVGPGRTAPLPGGAPGPAAPPAGPAAPQTPAPPQGSTPQPQGSGPTH